MVDDLTRAHFADLMEDLKASVEAVARAQREHAQLTATATAAGKRVTVVVNANGDVIQTRFSSDIEELTYPEIAAAMTKAAQDAAAQMRRRTREMIAGLKKDQARLPKLSEFLPGIPDLADLVPAAPEVSLAPPGAREGAQVAGKADGAMEFTDVVGLGRKHSGSGPNVADGGW
ncbi:YbaB/EbfC family nucleoid-associated protein [Nocardia australiensis]|uniref:YbaB/EbfC family nucleoid-associated protein n=1 Tax=Nocardia australiensis TaxID=2887191 RepID=UPI001D15464B|nr:YbaB/EbfC family nucleoid-associated protein [Nocardia australiensis]